MRGLTNIDASVKQWIALIKTTSVALHRYVLMAQTWPSRMRAVRMQVNNLFVANTSQINENMLDGNFFAQSPIIFIEFGLQYIFRISRNITAILINNNVT